jgi:hypothetical protein
MPEFFSEGANVVVQAGNYSQPARKRKDCKNNITFSCYFLGVSYIFSFHTISNCCQLRSSPHMIIVDVTDTTFPFCPSYRVKSSRFSLFSSARTHPHQQPHSWYIVTRIVNTTSFAFAIMTGTSTAMLYFLRTAWPAHHHLNLHLYRR